MGKKKHPFEKYIPRPERVHHGGPPRLWEPVQDTLGIEFPQDFKDYIAVYGSVKLLDDISIKNPFYSNYLRSRNLDACKFYERLSKEYPAETGDKEWAAFPKRPGLYPMGGDAFGYQYCWLIDGPPESWTIVVFTEAGHPFEFDMNFTDFFLQVFEAGTIPVVWTNEPLTRDENGNWQIISEVGYMQLATEERIPKVTVKRGVAIYSVD